MLLFSAHKILQSHLINSHYKFSIAYKYNSSSIYYFTDHSMSTLPLTLINNFRIVYSPSKLMNLKIAEAITVKTIKPLINVKFNLIV